jgi:outer membrane protein assembly factor BamB
MRDKWALRNRYLAALILVVTMCAGCSSGTTTRLTPLAPGSGNALTPASSSTHAKTARVTIRITSKSKHPGGKRLPRYISPSTLGIGVSAYPSGTTPPATDQAFFSAAPGSPTCTSNADGSRTCDFSINAPLGTDDFRVDLFDAVPSGESDSGKLLGTGYALNQIVTSTSVNTLNLVIDGIIASLAIAPNTIVPVENGTTQQFSVAVNLLDADGNYIVGSDPLENPVTLTLSGDPNQTLSLSAKTIATGAGNRVTLTYKSGQLVSGLLTATTSDGITASIPVQAFNVRPTSLTFTSTTPQTVTVSDAGYNSVFQATSSDPTCATVSPAVAPLGSQGSPVTFTVTPLTTSACTISIVGRVAISIPVSITLSGITVPGAQHWLIYPRTESLTVTEPGYTSSFVATVSGGGCVTPSPAAVAATNGSATFTITAAAAGTCTVTLTGSQPHAFPYTVYRDNYIMFGQNLQRTGNMSVAGVTLTKSTLSSLKLRYETYVGHSIVGTPLVVDGRIYVVSSDGTVQALDAKTGSILWSKVPFGAKTGIIMNPSYDNGNLFIGQHDPEGSVQFDSIGVNTGNTKWSVTFPGTVRGAPEVINGVVYIGTADGDPAPFGNCSQGGVYALSEATGAVVWHYVVDQTASDGGSVWSPISYDGSKLIFGTGNTCSPNAPLDDASNSVVALNPQTGAIDWVSNILEPQTVDDDDGSGGPVINGLYYTQSKNGNFYIINASTGLVQAKIPDGLSLYSGAATPVTDGTTVVACSGYRAPLTLLPYGSDGGLLYGFDMSGHQKWLVATSNWPVYSMSMLNGLVLAGMDNHINILDASTGAQLWSFPFKVSTEWMYGAPVVTPSGLYAVSIYGNLYAFGTDSTNSSAQFVDRRPVMTHAVEQYVPPNVKKAMGEF